METKATALFSLATLKSYVRASQPTHDTVLVAIGNAVTDRIENYTGRAFVQRAVPETLDGDGTRELRLRHFPVVSPLTSLQVRWTQLDAWTAINVATEVEVDTYRGIVYLKSGFPLHFPKGPLSVQIQYTAGWDAKDGANLPSDVVQAGLDYARFLYQRWETGAVFSQSVTVGQNGVTLAPDLPADIRRTLDAYRRVRSLVIRR